MRASPSRRPRTRSRCTRRSRRTRWPRRATFTQLSGCPTRRRRLRAWRSTRSAGARACTASDGAVATDLDRPGARRCEQSRCCSSACASASRSPRAICVRGGVRRWRRASSCVAARSQGRIVDGAARARRVRLRSVLRFADELGETFGEASREEKAARESSGASVSRVARCALSVASIERERVIRACAQLIRAEAWIHSDGSRGVA